MGNYKGSHLYKGMGKEVVLCLWGVVGKDEFDQPFFNVLVRFWNLGKGPNCSLFLSHIYPV